jgi:hypothetical protein
MTAPTTSATAKKPLISGATSKHDNALSNLAAELTSLMQRVIVDTTGAGYAAGQREM